MTASVTSIDRAASGYLRLRFVRAIGAAWFVLFIVAALLLIGLAVAISAPADTDKIGTLVAVVLVGVLLVPFAAALWDALPSWLAGLLGLIASAILLLLSLAVVAQAASQQAGRPLDADGIKIWVSTGVVALSAVIFAEGLLWGWWQTNASRAEFLAVRGWRPPAWRLFSALRARLGLPAFISNFGRGRLGLTVLYFLIAVLNIGLVAFLFAPALATYIPNDNTMVTPFLIVGGFLALPVVNALGVGALLQRAAAGRATKLYQDAREWDTRPPIVFLRAFDQDALKLPSRAADPIVKIPAGCGQSLTLDEILLEHASPYGPVIAIGDPRNPVPPLGAARVYVPEKGAGWQDAVTALVQASNAVVMCPNASEGVKWELDLLTAAAGRVRVIYVANPELGGDENAALFARLFDMPALPKRQQPLAAFRDAAGWRVLTSSTRPCVQVYAVALNTALQAMLGTKGAPLQSRLIPRS